MSPADTTGERRALSADEPLELQCGSVLRSWGLNYETYGRLSPARDNAILVCHSLTKDAHAASMGRTAGRRAGRRRGWWDNAIGPGKMLDTDSAFVISSDTLAAGRSTGPASPDPRTGKPYGLSFPVITIRDIVAAQLRLLDHLGIARLRAVIGGCFGGQQAVQWAISYPERVSNAVVITTTPATSAHSIAIFAVMRHLIRSDPDWRGGGYYGRSFPAAGLNGAVAAAVPLWMSRQAMEAKFGRRLAERRDRYSFSLDPDFAVEEFIARLVTTSRHEIDPNGLMYLTRAVEYFDLEREYGSLEAAFAAVTARVLFVSYRADWRYPPEETARMHDALRRAGGDSAHVILDSPLGHGAFLYDMDGLDNAVSAFLGRPVETRRAPQQGGSACQVPA
jgi:homoserine O-acetyltransferase